MFVRLANQLFGNPFAYRPKRRKQRPTLRHRFAAVTLERLEPRLLMAAGDLDTNFGGDGRVVVGFDFANATENIAYDVTVDKKGRSIVVGHVVTPDGDRWGVVRLRPNGRLDRTFSQDGKALFNFRNSPEIKGVAVGPKGRIAIVGTSWTPTGNRDVAIIRLTAAGRLDRTFSGDGRALVTFDAGGSMADDGEDIAFDRKGRILVAATVARKAFGDYDFGIARLKWRGGLDRGFGIDGKTIVPFDEGGELDDTARGIALDGNNRIVVAGSVEVGPNTYDFGVTRLRPNGRPDLTFATWGKAVIPFDAGGDNSDQAEGLAIDRHNRIVIAGTVATSTSGSDFGVARLSSIGILDSTFGTLGKQTIGFNFSPIENDVAKAVAIDRQGRIVVAGGVSRGSLGDQDFGVTRLTVNGLPDLNFSGDGKSVIAFDLGGLKKDIAQGVAIDRAGRIVVAGQVEGLPGWAFGIARLTS